MYFKLEQSSIILRDTRGLNNTQLYLKEIIIVLSTSKLSFAVLLDIFIGMPEA